MRNSTHEVLQEALTSPSLESHVPLQELHHYPLVHDAHTRVSARLMRETHL